MKFSLLACLFCLFLQTTSAQEDAKLALTPSELKLAQAIGFDPWVLKQMRALSDSLLMHFFVEEAPEYVGDSIVGSSDQFFPGLMMNLEAGSVDTMLYLLTDVFWEKGYHIFRTEDNYGNGPDQVGVLKTNVLAVALRAVGTDGLPVGLDNRKVIQIAENLQKRWPFHLTGAGRAWMECTLMIELPDCLPLAREIARICPGMLESGMGTEADLAKEIQETGIFYLWWD